MKGNPPGYPLPSGELGEDELVCQLVYLPDRDEYWQALLAAVHYFSTWHAWERGSDKRGKDAAKNWRAAFELTIGCWRMACLDEIVDRMDIMIDLLGNQSSCCGTTTIGPIIIVTTIITPGEGDDPTEWGETEVADWDEWMEYVCYHAHAYVDSLIEGAKAIDIAIELGSYTIDFFVGIMRFMQYLGLDQVLGLNQVMMVYDDFRGEADLSGWFTPLADKFEDARQDIVCAILQGGSLSDAVENAVDDNAVWLLFYVLTDFDAVQALMYEATVDGTEYLSAIKRDDCDCDEPSEFAFTWDSDLQGWTSGGQLTQVWEASHQAMECVPTLLTTWQPGGGLTGNQIATRFELDTPIIVKRIRYRIRFEANGESEIEFRHRVIITEVGDATHVSDIVSSFLGYEEWHEINFTFPAAYELRPTEQAFHHEARRQQSQTGQRFIIDDLQSWPE